MREIVGVPGRVEGGVVETADVFGTRDGRLVRGDGFPPHADRFERLGLDLRRAAGPGGLADGLGALLGLLLGAGLLLLWRPGGPPRPVAAPACWRRRGRAARGGPASPG